MTDQVVKALKPEEVKRILEQRASTLIPATEPAVEEDDDIEFLDGGPESVEVPLKRPFKFKGVEYRSVTVNPFRGEHFIPMQALMRLHGLELAMPLALTGLPAKVLKRMDVGDFIAITNAVTDFLPPEFLAQMADEETNEQTGETGPNT